MNIQSTSRWLAAGHLALEALAGALAGLACAAIVGLAGARLFANASSGWGDLIAGILGAIIGYTVGVSLGVYRAGRRLSRRGRYWPALLGAVLGAALVLLVAEPLRLNANPAVLQGFLIAIPPLLATLAFNVGLKLRK